MSIRRHCDRKRHGRVYRPVTEAMRFRSSARWQRFRAWYRSQHLLCERREPAGVMKASEEVHHVIPLADAPHRGLDPNSVLALCRPCHEELEKQA